MIRKCDLEWFSNQQPDLSYFARDEQTTISRRQLDQKIIRVCISYTHFYPIKSVNHTSPSRKCKLCFWANMQVASTLWPDIKSQKISNSIGPSVAQEPHQIHSRQARTNMDQTRQPRTTHQRRLGAVGTTGRPADLPGVGVSYAPKE